MKTGITSSAFYDSVKKETDYARMKKRGYDFCDYSGLMDTKTELYTGSASYFESFLKSEKQKAESAGITFSQVHAPWPTDDSTEKSRAERFEFMKRAVEGTALLNGKYLVVHPLMPSWDSEENPDETEKLNEIFCTELCGFAKSYQIGICIENMPMKKLRLSRTPKMLEFANRLDLDNLFMCLDTGHCNVFGDDCGEMVRLCGKKLKTLHVHDNSSFCDEHLIPYCGNVNWASFKAALKEIGFGGVLSIEASFRSDLPESLKEYYEITLAKTAKSLAE